MMFINITLYANIKIYSMMYSQSWNIRHRKRHWKSCSPPSPNPYPTCALTNPNSQCHVFLLNILTYGTPCINEFRCYEAKSEKEVKKPAVAGSRIQDTLVLNRQCSATEPQQPDNHHPSQSSICTAQ